jgi:hypothetical protein
MLAEELVHVFELKALQHLTLHGVLAAPLSEDMARQLRPPSATLPALVRSDLTAAFTEEDNPMERALLGMPLLDEEAYDA